MEKIDVTDLALAKAAVRAAIRDVRARQLMEGLRGTFEHRRRVMRQGGSQEDDPDMLSALSRAFNRALRNVWYTRLPAFTSIHLAPLDEGFLSLAENSVDRIDRLALEMFLAGYASAQEEAARSSDEHIRRGYPGTLESLVVRVFDGFRMYMLEPDCGLGPDPW